MSLASSLLVRFVHVSGMALIFGGAVFVWAALRTSDRSTERLADGGRRSLATTYEWAFWGTMGLLLVTGVGNLGTLGPPGPTTRWGTVLTVKLAAVIVFVLGSFVRTLVVLRLRGERPSASQSELLSKSYGATAGVVLVLVALAEVLAHG
ncbi:hypothetical protein E6P09_10690 [Haloferax mediterranei ATCC 33500]|uniref:Copper resistance protein D domain-containing protein n=1 Tax=Haloferax mediterranei (strain ATCC 33500 / DSM 1411 / JCM 8866 / NBRC 14739 / NCIMB 2177 / R-4) TaxID=523841 RepID=M0J670_HALMT|nr:CopD family protein [Haloferax mediterranei]AHZ21401.1 hypothetical protein BM92_01475 [Haloferax mediterranei ATCC 33500]EMA03858.1 hypothetical protein C439_02833 [Haloferax mediterranei ATCC 33500]MDX5989339.1 CopD family protein [Haloferax mediterranei ATCC 33500]QCQ75705.1 hypothetical protein E6P09_10690 [Haloferax mediterranei ATCC 33500]